MRWKSRMSSGTTTTTTQAPSVNLENRKTRVARAVTTAPIPLSAAFRRQRARAVRPPVHHHARLGQGEADEHADGEEGDQRVGVAPDHHQQHGGGDAEGPDALGEDQAVAPQGEGVGQVVVAGQQAGQHRQAPERGVGGQAQHHGDGQRDDVVRPSPGPPSTPSPGSAPSGRSGARRGTCRTRTARPEQHHPEQDAQAGARSAWPGPGGAGGTAAPRWRWPPPR